MAMSETYLDSDDLHPIDIVEHIAMAPPLISVALGPGSAPSARCLL